MEAGFILRELPRWIIMIEGYRINGPGQGDLLLKKSFFKAAALSGPHAGKEYPARPQGEEGFALIMVIWSLGLISVLILAFTFNVRTQTQIAAASLQAAALEAAADAGIYLAIGDIVISPRRSSAKPRFSPNGAPSFCRISDQIVLEISVQDEEGKVDLNAAGEALLRALLEGLGVGAQNAARYADALIDYRDADDLRRLNGAEQDDYQQAGHDAGPSNAPYVSVDELYRVFGLPKHVAEKLKPLMTIRSNRGGIDPGRAPSAVIAALSGGAALPPLFAITSRRRVFAIRVAAHGLNGGQFVREAIAERTSSAQRHYRLLEWRRGDLISPGELGLKNTDARC